MLTPSAPPTPHVAVVLLSYNQKDNTLECLESFQSVTYEKFSLFLVDNGSTDGTYEAATKTFPSVHVFKAKSNLGCSGGRNFGAQKAIELCEPEYLLFVDNDTIVDADFLTQLLKIATERKNTGIVTAKILDFKKKDIIDMVGNKVNLFTGKTPKIGLGEKDRGQYDSLDQLAGASSCCHFIPIKVWLQLGGYDAAFDPYGYEDLDLSMRTRKLGKKIYLASKSIIYHKKTQTLGGGKYVSTYTRVKGRNMRRFLAKHAKLHHKIGFFILAPFLGITTMLRAIRSGDPSAAFRLVSAFFSTKEKK